MSNVREFIVQQGLVTLTISDDIFEHAIFIGSERQKRNDEAHKKHASAYSAIKKGQTSENSAWFHQRGAIAEAAWLCWYEHIATKTLQKLAPWEFPDWTAGVAWTADEHNYHRHDADISGFGDECEVRSVMKMTNDPGVRIKDVKKDRRLLTAFPHYTRMYQPHENVITLLGAYDLGIVHSQNIWDRLFRPSWVTDANSAVLPRTVLMTAGKYTMNLLKDTTPIWDTEILQKLNHRTVATTNGETNPFWN